MGFFSDVKDTLFGTKPEARTFELERFDPRQKQIFSKLTPFLKQDIEATKGEVPGLSALESTSLAGLEKFAEELITRGTQPSKGVEAASTSLQDILGRGPQDFEEFFGTVIREPALQEFEEDILPRIGRTFGGSQFFGSERREADTEAREDLIDALTRSRSELGFRSRQQDIENVLKAVGLTEGVERAGDIPSANVGRLLSVLEGGALPRNIELQRLARRDKRVAQMLQSLGLSPKENVVVAEGGQEGITGDLFRAAMMAKSAGAF